MNLLAVFSVLKIPRPLRFPVFLWILLLGSSTALWAGESGTWSRMTASWETAEVKGKSVQALNIIYWESLASEQILDREDVTQAKNRLLKAAAPKLLQPGSRRRFNLKFLGREITQEASGRLMIAKAIFRYAHPEVSNGWKLDEPILVEFEGKEFELIPPHPETRP